MTLPAPARTDAPAGMRRIEGRTFTMGSELYYPEEAPRRQVAVDGFWIDATPVTNRQFGAFVRATGHVTDAEIAPDPRDYPGMAPEAARAGSLVFEPAPDSAAPMSWWRFAFGAHWRKPYGPASSILKLQDHPVVQVSHRDAAAYAAWAGKALPTEAEWELAARGGLDDAPFAWGDTFAPAGKLMCNIWHGAFPHQNLRLDGFDRTSPVRSFPPNGYGAYDMIGNVWEWTDDWWSTPVAKAGPSCCVPKNPRGGPAQDSLDPADPAAAFPRKVLKGGSHLCADNYCRRYRPAARIPQTVESAASHIGFRCIVRQ